METNVSEETYQEGKRKLVLCPIAPKDPTKKTLWVRMGTAFVNKDNSINLYLNGLPVNGKLQVRDFDEREEREWQERRAVRRSSTPVESNNTEIPF